MAYIVEVLYEKSQKNGKPSIASTSPTVGWGQKEETAVQQVDRKKQTTCGGGISDPLIYAPYSANLPTMSISLLQCTASYTVY
jgi:hypothetical protein